MAISKIDPAGLDLTGDAAFDTDTLVVDSTNNRVGINTDSPAFPLQIVDSGTTANVEIESSLSTGAANTGGLVILSGHNGTTASRDYVYIKGAKENSTVGNDDSYFSISTRKTGGIPAERIRIDSDGKLLCGITSDATTANAGFSIVGSAGRIEAFTASGNKVMRFYKVAGNENGSIQMNASSVSYNTSSDYRLKENVVDMTGAVDRVKALNPSQFNFIVDPDTTVDGFLAHEVADVVPEAVTGTKDAMQTEEYEVTPAVLDEDGNVVTEAVMGTREVPDYQGIDQSKLVPLLTGALQEAIGRIETLEAEVATLKEAN
jgi:hypothetical protein